MTTASSFDWSEWDKESIIDMVYMARGLVVGQTLTITEFNTRLTRHIKYWLPVRSRKSLEPQVDRGHVWIGGMYYTDYDQKKQKSKLKPGPRSHSGRLSCLKSAIVKNF